MKTMIIGLMLAAAPALAGDLKAELTANIEKWATDFNAHDAKALAAHYTDDVQYIYPFEGQEGKSRKAIQAYYEQSFKQTPDVAVKLISYEVVPVSDTVAVGLGIWEDSLTGPDGKKLTIPTHASEVWVKKGGKWIVRLDHASFVPPPPPPPPPEKKPAAPAPAPPAKK